MSKRQVGTGQCFDCDKEISKKYVRCSSCNAIWKDSMQAYEVIPVKSKDSKEVRDAIHRICTDDSML